MALACGRTAGKIRVHTVRWTVTTTALDSLHRKSYERAAAERKNLSRGTRSGQSHDWPTRKHQSGLESMKRPPVCVVHHIATSVSRSSAIAGLPSAVFRRVSHWS
jgi:hypothetical protein